MPGKLQRLSGEQAFHRWARIASYENSEYNKYQTDCKENRDFYYGAQFTQDELDDMEDRGQFSVAVNKTRKAINGIVGLLAANQPLVRFIPVGDSDNSKATLASRLNDWVWYNSGGVQTYRKAVKAAARDNVSFLHLVWSGNKVKFTMLGFDDIVVDPRSTDTLFDDAEYIFIKRWIPVERAKALYGIEDLPHEFPSVENTRYSDWTSTLSNFKIFDSNKSYVKVYEGYRKVTVRHDDGHVSTHINKEVHVGWEYVYVERLPEPIRHYPIIPLFSEDTENPYKRGEIHFLKGLQRFINKSYGVTILNAQLMSNPKVFLRETDIPEMDIESFEDDYSKPGSVNILTADASEPIVVQGQPLNTAFFTLFDDAKREFEEATLPPDVLGYQDSSAQAAYNPTRILDVREAVLDSFKFFAGNLETAAARLALVSIQYCRAYLTGEATITIVDGMERLKSIQINKQAGLDVNNRQSLQQFIEHQLNNGMPQYEVESIVSEAQRDEEFANSISYMINDVSDLNVDVHVVPGSYAPNFEMANLKLSMELYDRQVVDAQEVLNHAPLENREEIADRISLVNQQARAIEQMTTQLEELDAENKSLRKRMADTEVRSAIEEAKLKQDKIVNDVRANARVAKSKLNLKVQEITNKTKVEANELLRKLERQTEAPDETRRGPDDSLVAEIMQSISN